MGLAVAADAGLVAQRRDDALADGDGRILGRVVLVHMEVALDVARDVDQRMAAELFDHVIEKADPGIDPVSAGAVQVDRHRNVGFCGFAGDGAGAHGFAL